MDNNKEDLKRFALWFGVGVILIGSFLTIMFLNNPTPTTPGLLSKAVTAEDWSKGEKNSKVTLVEYSDFQCPACRNAEGAVQAIMGEFGTHISFTYRNFPLRTIHQNSQISAQAAEAAGMQGKFWEMHSLLFMNQTIWSSQPADVVQATFADYAKQLGLNVEQFKKDMVSEKAASLVDEDAKSGEASGVDSTPTFFLNNKQLKPQSNDDFRKSIRDAVDASA